MLTHGAYIRAKWEEGGEGRGRRGEGKLALENVKPTDSPIYRPPSEFAVRAFRKTSRRRGTRARAWKSDGNRARRRGVFRFPCTRTRPRAYLGRLHSSRPPPSSSSARGAFRWRVADDAADAGGEGRKHTAGEGRERGSASGRPTAGVRPILRSRNGFYSPIFGRCELRNGGGVLVGRGSRVHSTGRWTAGWARATRVSLRKSRKKASDVPATVRRTADIAAPCRAVSRAVAQLAHARGAPAAPCHGREIRTNSSPLAPRDRPSARGFLAWEYLNSRGISLR